MNFYFVAIYRTDRDNTIIYTSVVSLIFGLLSGCNIGSTRASTYLESVLYRFQGGADGAYPFASLMADNNANLYGTTSGDGVNNYGTVFKITPQGVKSVVHNFESGSDGAVSYASLIADADGNLYGTTQLGGDNSYFGHGTVFKLKLK